MPNRIRYDGTADRFYEVWYFIFTDPASGDGFWIRYTLLNPKDSRPEAGGTLWFGYTCRADPARSFAVKQTFPRDFDAPHGTLRLRIGESELEEGRLRGSLQAEGHSASWDLRYTPNAETHYFFGERLRRLTESRNSVTIPNPRIALSGTVTVDGRTLEIHEGPGHQAHHWGRARAPRWIWGHGTAFDEDPGAVVEMLSGEGPGGVMLTFVNLYTKDESHLCNGVHGFLFNRAASGPGFWHFEGFTDSHQVVADVTVDPRLVQRFVYTSPGYKSSECWNTQVGDCIVRLYEGTVAGSQRLVRTLRARGTTAAEIHDQRPERIIYNAYDATARS